MEKRTTCFIFTIVGLIIIISIKTIFLVLDDEEEKHNNYIKENLILITKECIKDEVCKHQDVTIEYLINKNYINSDLLKEVSEYSLESYIKYPEYIVVFIEKEE